MREQVAGKEISISFTVAGSGTADVAWDPTLLLARAVDSRWSFDATVRLAQVGGNLRAALPARIEFSRAARLLDDGSARGPERSDLPGLIRLMEPERARWWKLWADPDTDAGVRAIAFAVLRDLGNPDGVAPWATRPEGEMRELKDF
jgi:hypothetical protein